MEENQNTEQKTNHTRIEENNKMEENQNTEQKANHTKRPEVARELNSEIKSLIEVQHPEVRKRVVEALAAVEMEKRVSAVTKAFQKISEMEKELQNAKPDGPEPALDINGKPLSERGWTKAALDKLSEARKRMDKWKDALALAIPSFEEGQETKKPDFQKLYELTK